MLKNRFWQSTVAFLLLPVSSLSGVVWFGSSSAAIAQARSSNIRPSDIQGHWAQNCMQVLAQQGILTPDARGAFRPNDAVSRLGYALAIQRSFPNRPPVQNPIQFRDLRPNSATARSVQSMQQAGFWLGDGRNEFRPGDGMARAQAFGGLANGLGYSARQAASKDLRAAFKDGRMVPDFAKNEIAAALENRLIVNYPDLQRLNPNQPIRRAELAAALCQTSSMTAAYVPQQYIAQAAGTVLVSTPTGGKPSRPAGPVVVGDRAVPPNRPGSVIIQVPGSVTPPIVTPPIFMPPRVPSREIRGVWLTNIDSPILFNPRLLRDSMQELGKLNFNTVYPVVWNWGYTVYPSQVAQRVTGYAIDPRYTGLQGRDPLAELVEQGREHRIAVIPWFEFGFMAPADSELARLHPDWLTRRQDGSTIWQEGQDSRVWLNPLNPEVQQFILSIILEIVTKYGVDGIQFDDHMGLPSDFGYDPYTIALYQQENPGKEPPTNFKDPAWLKWRADKITEFMGRVYRAIKARKSHVTVALSPNPQKFSYENSLQDWATWRRLGYVEELILQVYRPDISSFEVELRQPEVQEAKLHIPVGIGILTGLKNKPVPINLVQEKLQKTRELGFAGVSFFFYETMWNLSNEPVDYRKDAFRELMTPVVPRPSLVNGWTPEQ